MLLPLRVIVLQLIVERGSGAATQVAANTQLMNVAVPSGVTPGQTICVQTPSGMSVTAVVPENVVAGQSFQLAVPISAPPAVAVAQAVAITSPPPAAKRSFSMRGLQMQGGNVPRELPTVQAEVLCVADATGIASHDVVTVEVEPKP